jgi:pyruvate formate lyase activating enzyme
MWKLDIEDVAVLEKTEGRQLSRHTPERMVAEALQAGCLSVASTYNEPTVSSEFAHEVFKLAKSKGLYTAYVTNGFESVETLNYLGPYLDAVNIDLKSFREKFYWEICGAHLNGVCETIRRCVAMGIHTEVTTLVIPGTNDSDAELRDIAQFLVSVDPRIPWHVSAYHDDYKFQGLGRTPVQTLQRAASIGKKAGLLYIYMGNVSHSDSRVTNCPKCGAKLVDRDWGHAKIRMKNGRCSCGVVIPGLWADADNRPPKLDSVPAALAGGVQPSGPSGAPGSTRVVFYATKGGTAKRFAEMVANRHGFDLRDISDLTVEELQKLQKVVFSVATYGRGDPPASALGFWKALNEVKGLNVKGGIEFAVIGCGSSSFGKSFGGFARNLEDRLCALGLRKVKDAIVRDEDQDGADDGNIAAWINGLKFN